MSKFYFNQQVLMGNVTQQPELKMTQGGTAVLRFSVATNHSFKKGDEWEDKATFHNVVMFGNLASAVSKNLDKGVKVFVAGRTEHRSWEHEGKTYYRTEIIADTVIPQSSQGASAATNTNQEEVNPDDIPDFD